MKFIANNLIPLSFIAVKKHFEKTNLSDAD